MSMCDLFEDDSKYRIGLELVEKASYDLSDDELDIFVSNIYASEECLINNILREA